MTLISRHVKNSAYSCINLKFISIGLSDQHSVYLRNLSRKDPCDLEYGSKSGPNLQFFKSIKAVSEYVTEGNSEAIILLETDAIPIKPNWLEILNTSISSSPEFWIAGGKYQGASQMSPAIVNHINGNAIYGVGALGFRDFLHDWQNLLRYAVTKQHWIAYDIVLPILKYRHENKNEKLEPKAVSILNAAFGKMLDVSDLILNISGQHENISDHINNSLLIDKTVICHSRPLARRISWCLCPEMGLKLQALHLENPLNQRLACLNISCLAYLNFNHPKSFSTSIGKYIVNSSLFLRHVQVKSLFLACLSTSTNELTSGDTLNG